MKKNTQVSLFLIGSTIFVIIIYLSYSYKNKLNHQITIDLNSPTVTTIQEVFTQTPPTQTPSPTRLKKDLVVQDVPFTVQSPFADWKDPRQQDACEEASVLMAMHWVKNEKILSKEAAKEEILAISKFQEDKFGSYHDTSALDTGKRIIEGYYHYKNYEIKPVITAEDIINQIDYDNIVIVPANGQLLHNPNFTQPGPERHMLVIKGYDRINGQFITNETGVSQGENWKYNKEILFSAIRDYPTGYHVPILKVEKVMIIIKK